MNQTFVNQTFLNLADRILFSYYPNENITLPILGNDQLSRFFVSPIMELIIRHVFFLFATGYIQNQAAFYSNISMISYYMTPTWIENRMLYRLWNKYSKTYFDSILYVSSKQVNYGDKWGIMIIKDYDYVNHSGTEETIYPYVKDALWLDWKVKNGKDDANSSCNTMTISICDQSSSKLVCFDDNTRNGKILVPRAPGITHFHEWLNEKVKEEYTRVVMATLPF